MKFSRWLPVVFLLPTLDCVSIKFKDAAKGKEIDIGGDMNETSGARQSLMGPTSTASIQSDWSAMLESSRIFEEYAREIDVEKYHSSHLQTVQEQIDQLNTIQNLLEHVFGKPRVPLQNSLVEPQRVWNNEDKSLVEYFETSAWDLISSFQLILDLKQIPDGLHHLQVVFNNCVLQTLELIRRYNLAPPELNQKIQTSLRSKQGLECFSLASANIFRSDTRFDNDFSWSPFLEIHLKHHFQLSHFFHIFQDLARKEKQWVLFQYMLVRMGPSFREEVLNNEYTTKMEQDQLWRLLVLFARKLKNFLSKELEGDNQEDSSRRFLIDMRDDVVEMAKVCINPLNAIIENNFAIGYDILHIVVLEFLHHHLGLKDMSSELFGDEVGVNIVEFEQKFGLVELSFNMRTCANLLMDYLYNISESSDQGPKVKKITTRAEKEEMEQFYWKNLQASIIAYKEWKARQFEIDRSWKEKLESNQFYKELVNALDKLEAKIGGKLYEEVDSMLH